MSRCYATVTLTLADEEQDVEARTRFDREQVSYDAELLIGDAWVPAWRLELSTRDRAHLRRSLESAAEDA